MRNKTVMWELLSKMVEEVGADEFLEMLCSRVAEGESPVEISRNIGLSWFVVREWLEAGDKMKRLELAKRCFADGLVWEGLEAARDATPESVSVDRLKVDTFHKIAGKMSRVEWGGEAATVGGAFAGGVTIVIGEVKSPYLTVEPIQEAKQVIDVVPEMQEVEI